MNKAQRNSKSPEISPLDAHLGFWLRMVSNQVSGEFIRAIEASGVSGSEWVALRSLWDRTCASPAELIVALGMTKGAVSKILSKLDDKGLVVRTTVDADARAQRIRLTDAGRALVPRLAAVADDNDRRFFGHLNATQQAAMREVLLGIAAKHELVQVPTD